MASNSSNDDYDDHKSGATNKPTSTDYKNLHEECVLQDLAVAKAFEDYHFEQQQACTETNDNSLIKRQQQLCAAAMAVRAGRLGALQCAILDASDDDSHLPFLRGILERTALEIDQAAGSTPQVLALESFARTMAARQDPLPNIYNPESTMGNTADVDAFFGEYPECMREQNRDAEDDSSDDDYSYSDMEEETEEDTRPPKKRSSAETTTQQTQQIQKQHQQRQKIPQQSQHITQQTAAQRPSTLAAIALEGHEAMVQPNGMASMGPPPQLHPNGRTNPYAKKKPQQPPPVMQQQSSNPPMVPTITRANETWDDYHDSNNDLQHHHQEQQQVNPFQTAREYAQTNPQPMANPYQQQQPSYHNNGNHQPQDNQYDSFQYTPPPQMEEEPADNQVNIRSSLKQKFRNPSVAAVVKSNKENQEGNSKARKQGGGGALAKKITKAAIQNQNGGAEAGSSNDDGDDDDLPESLKKYGKELVERIRDEIVDRGDPVTFDDIAGLLDAKKTIQEVVCWPMKRPDLFTGLRAAPNGVLLYGPPGTGKTLIGKAIAHESGATFFSISSSALTSKWIGEGEKLVRILFAVASCEEPAVVFIDEIDSLLTQRSSDENEASRRIKTEFLVQLDGVGTSGQGRVLVIGATNRPQELDDAARRRFVKRLYIPLPEESDREMLLRALLEKNKHKLTDKDIKKLAADTHGFSGADLKSLCTDAAMGPIRFQVSGSNILNINVEDVPPISFKHFRQALRGTKPSVSPDDITQYLEFDKNYGSNRCELADDDDEDDDGDEDAENK